MRSKDVIPSFFLRRARDLLPFLKATEGFESGRRSLLPDLPGLRSLLAREGDGMTGLFRFAGHVFPELTESFS